MLNPQNNILCIWHLPIVGEVQFSCIVPLNIIQGGRRSDKAILVQMHKPLYLIVWTATANFQQGIYLSWNFLFKVILNIRYFERSCFLLSLSIFEFISICSIHWLGRNLDSRINIVGESIFVGAFWLLPINVDFYLRMLKPTQLICLTRTFSLNLYLRMEAMALLIIVRT